MCAGSLTGMGPDLELPPSTSATPGGSTCGAVGANDAQYLLPNRTQVETYTRGPVDGRDYGEKMGDPRGEAGH